jgi:hypothetical protein
LKLSAISVSLNFLVKKSDITELLVSLSAALQIAHSVILQVAGTDVSLHLLHVEGFLLSVTLLGHLAVGLDLALGFLKKLALMSFLELHVKLFLSQLWLGPFFEATLDLRR